MLQCILGACVRTSMVSLLRLFGVSAKHLSEDVSTTVSQKATTGSATLTSTSAYSSLRSCVCVLGRSVWSKWYTGKAL